MEPTCTELANALHIDQEAAKLAMEDAVRGMPHAPLAQVLAPVDSALQKLLGGSLWRIVSPIQSASGSVIGKLRLERSLANVQEHVYAEPTVIVAEQVLRRQPHDCNALGLQGSTVVNTFFAKHLSWQCSRGTTKGPERCCCVGLPA